MPQVALTVNGKNHTVEVEGRTLLVELLREKLRLTGTHVGCDTSQCGACVVHVDGESVKSCTILALQADGSSVTTIEGLAAPDGTLHPMQEAFREYHALQCGFCTPGMVMSAIDLVQKHPEGLTERVIREGLEGNLCRCTGYQNIVKAVQYAAGKTAGKDEMDRRIHEESRPMVAEEPEEIDHPRHEEGVPHDPQTVADWEGELAGESDDA